jgi:hypothetical protein
LFVNYLFYFFFSRIPVMKGRKCKHCLRKACRRYSTTLTTTTLRTSQMTTWLGELQIWEDFSRSIFSKHVYLIENKSNNMWK